MHVQEDSISSERQEHPNIQPKNQHYSLEEVVHILLDDFEGKDALTCKKPPIGCQQEATFLIDLECIPSRKNVLADDLGVFRNCGLNRTEITVEEGSSWDGMSECIMLASNPIKLNR